MASSTNGNGKRERDDEEEIEEEKEEERPPKSIRNGDDDSEQEDEKAETVKEDPPEEKSAHAGGKSQKEDKGVEKSKEGPVALSDEKSQKEPVATEPSPAPPVPTAAPVMDQADNEDEIVEERGEIAAEYVGKVIGKVSRLQFRLVTLNRAFFFQGGEMIRDLHARSNCRIDVEQNVPQGQPRGISFRGTRKTVDFAKHLVQRLQNEGVTEHDLPLGSAQSRVIVISSSTVGKVIGRGGEMVRELQNKSQAKIQIDHSGAASGIPSDKKQVTVIGTEEAVVKAEEMINFLSANPAMEGLQALSLLMEEKHRSGGNWGSGPPYPGLPNQGSNMTSDHPPPHHQHQDPYAYGAPPTQGYPPAPGYGQPYNPSHYAPPPQQHTPTSASSSGANETDTMTAQKHFMGRIIGKKGVTINDLQRRSGVNIQVNQEVPAGQDCEIILRGVRQGIDMAKSMIREIIDVGPHHQVRLSRLYFHHHAHISFTVCWRSRCVWWTQSATIAAAVRTPTSLSVVFTAIRLSSVCSRSCVFLPGTSLWCAPVFSAVCSSTIRSTSLCSSTSSLCSAAGGLCSSTCFAVSGALSVCIPRSCCSVGMEVGHVCHGSSVLLQ